jgi:hypothetical protein
MELAHLLGRLDVDWVLGLDALGRITGNEPEELDVLVEVFERQFGLRVGFKIIEPETRKVGNDDIAGKVAVGKSVEIIQGLRIG